MYNRSQITEYFNQYELYLYVQLLLFKIIVGVCGKDSSTAALQDLQLHFNIGIGQWANAIKNKGKLNLISCLVINL